MKKGGPRVKNGYSCSFGLVPEFIASIAIKNSNNSLVDEMWEVVDDKVEEKLK